jgi:general stress protein 26
MITTENKQKLWSLIQPLKTGFLVTYTDGHFEARPMHLVQSEFIDKLYFFSNVHSSKASELQANPNVCLTFGCPKAQTYVSLAGTAVINQDPALIEELWNPFVAAWFPKGKSDPAVGLIEVSITQAELWDSNSNTFVQLFEYAKAAITHTTPVMGEHQKL